MENKLSVITIAYNNREGLAHTLASLREQTEQAFDLIVVDGGSNDGSVELIEQNLDLITQWVSEADAGIYDAQNKGWRMAKTPFVLFLNAGDTLVGPQVLERALPSLKPNVDILYGDAQLSVQGKVGAVKYHPEHITSAWLMKEVVAHQAQFIRRGLLESMQGYETRYRIAADYAFFARAFWQGRLLLRKVDMVICAFDLGGLSSSPSRKRESAQERKNIQRRYAPRFWYLVYHAYAALNRLIGR